MSDYRIMAIDPGPDESGWVILGENLIPIDHGIWSNDSLLLWIGGEDLRPVVSDINIEALAIEMMAAHGKPVPQVVLDTCVIIGEFKREFEGDGRGVAHMIYHRNIRKHLCGQHNAKKSHIRCAVIDKYGGSRRAAFGLKKAPGPLYGITDHAFDALAVGITFMETMR